MGGGFIDYLSDYQLFKKDWSVELLSV